MFDLPADYSAGGSLEECDRVTAMTISCQLESIISDAVVVFTPPGLPGDTVMDCA